MRARIAVLPGDGIGPEVTREAVLCLRAVAEAFRHEFEFATWPIGISALGASGTPLPDETLDACLTADAVLLGAVGGGQDDRFPDALRPEAGLLALRKELHVYANLRPVALPDALLSSSPLKAKVVRGTDLVIVRELAGGLYFGEPRGVSETRAFNTLVYTSDEVERVARVAFDLARSRRRKVTSVDKENVLETSRLWRRVVTEVGRSYPDVSLEHLHVDAAAMALVTRPTTFDVVLTENLFGDILSDEAAVLAGSLGMLPSASLGGLTDLYEPVHGSAPDIAGRGLANPVGAIASAALLLRHSFALDTEARLLERAIAETLADGFGTPDLVGARHRVGTAGLGDEVRRRIGELAGGESLVPAIVLREAHA